MWNESVNNTLGFLSPFQLVLKEPHWVWPFHRRGSICVYAKHPHLHSHLNVVVLFKPCYERNSLKWRQLFVSFSKMIMGVCEDKFGNESSLLSCRIMRTVNITVCSLFLKPIILITSQTLLNVKHSQNISFAYLQSCFPFDVANTTIEQFQAYLMGIKVIWQVSII